MFFFALRLFRGRPFLGLLREVWLMAPLKEPKTSLVRNRCCCLAFQREVSRTATEDAFAR